MRLDPKIAELLAAEDAAAASREPTLAEQRAACAQTAIALGGAPVPDAQTRFFDTMTHGFLRWGAVVREAQDLIDWLA